MKKPLIIIGILFVFAGLIPLAARAADETLVFDSVDNYLGACSYTDSSEWTLTGDLAVSKFQLWYNWQAGETSLPVTVTKDGQAFATFTAVRGSCDPYQASWCNADYDINKTLPAGTYTTKIGTSRQCLKPGGTGAVRLYSLTAAAGTTNVNGSGTTTNENANINTGLTAAAPTAVENANATVTNSTNVNTAKETTTGTSNMIWYIIVAVLAVIIIILLVRLATGRKKPTA